MRMIRHSLNYITLAEITEEATQYSTYMQGSFPVCLDFIFGFLLAKNMQIRSNEHLNFPLE